MQEGFFFIYMESIWKAFNKRGGVLAPVNTPEYETKDYFVTNIVRKLSIKDKSINYLLLHAEPICTIKLKRIQNVLISWQLQ